MELETPVKVNKSKLVFAAFKLHGLECPANDVINFIKTESNVEVTPGLVNNLRHRLRKERTERKARKMTPTTVAALPTTTEENMWAKLFSVKEFAARMGGLEELKLLVSKLELLAAA